MTISIVRRVANDQLIADAMSAAHHHARAAQRAATQPLPSFVSARDSAAGGVESLNRALATIRSARGMTAISLSAQRNAAHALRDLTDASSSLASRNSMPGVRHAFATQRVVDLLTEASNRSRLAAYAAQKSLDVSRTAKLPSKGTSDRIAARADDSTEVLDHRVSPYEWIDGAYIDPLTGKPPRGAAEPAGPDDVPDEFGMRSASLGDGPDDLGVDGPWFSG